MITEQELKKILQDFKGKKILIVGDVMVDEYLWGTVSRISPEAPVPVVSCSKREHRMGGAANVAINVKAMGAEPIMCSVIGEDEVGTIYRNLLKKREMSEDGILESASRITTVKTRVIGNHQHLLRVDQEVTDFIEPALEDSLLKKVEEQLNNQKIDAIIFQDYDKGVLTPKVIVTVIEMAKQYGIPTLVDPKKRSFKAYKGVSVFKPNFKEVAEGLNLTLNKSEAEGIFEKTKQFITEQQIGNLVVTLSEKGVWLSNGENYAALPAKERDIADVSGAGDTVIAILALCAAIHIDIHRAAELANTAGGLVCEKIGVVPVTPELFLSDYVK